MFQASSKKSMFLFYFNYLEVLQIGIVEFQNSNQHIFNSKENSNIRAFFK